MSESKYESKITSSSSSAHDIFRVMSDLTNINKVKDLIPQDKVKEIQAEKDNVRIKVDGLGPMVGIRIVDMEADKMIKFELENIPMEGHFWVQMKEVQPGDTRLKLTIKADLPMMLKMMLDKKLGEGLNQAAEMLAQMPFERM